MYVSVSGVDKMNRPDILQDFFVFASFLHQSYITEWNVANQWTFYTHTHTFFFLASIIIIIITAYPGQRFTGVWRQLSVDCLLQYNNQASKQVSNKSVIELFHFIFSSNILFIIIVYVTIFRYNTIYGLLIHSIIYFELSFFLMILSSFFYLNLWMIIYYNFCFMKIFIHNSWKKNRWHRFCCCCRCCCFFSHLNLIIIQMTAFDCSWH